MPRLPIGDIGPCEVVWDFGGQNELNLSPFLGKVKLKDDDAVAKVYEEAYGDAPVDAVFSGSVMDLEVPMTRSTLAQIEAMNPGSSLVGNVLTIRNKCGQAMYPSAKAICIKPMVNGVASTDVKEWTVLFKCAPYAAWEIGFDRKDQRVMLCKFMVFPSLESGEEGQYGTIGSV